MSTLSLYLSHSDKIADIFLLEKSASRRVWSLSKKCAPSLIETTVDEPEGTSVTGPSPSTAPVARI